MKTIKNPTTLKPEYVLYGCLIGQPNYMETIITTTTNPDHEEYFETAKAWATANGFDRFRVAFYDYNDKPDFTKSINI